MAGTCASLAARPPPPPTCSPSTSPRTTTPSSPSPKKKKLTKEDLEDDAGSDADWSDVEMPNRLLIHLISDIIETIILTIL